MLVSLPFFHILLILQSLSYMAVYWLLQLILNKVLFLGSPTQTIIGRPTIPDAGVHAVVEEHVSFTLIFVFSACLTRHLFNDMTLSKLLKVTLICLRKISSFFLLGGDNQANEEISHNFPLIYSGLCIIFSLKTISMRWRLATNNNYKSIYSLGIIFLTNSLGCASEYRNCIWFFSCQALDAKVIIFKKKRRKNYRRTKGHRQVCQGPFV